MFNGSTWETFRLAPPTRCQTKISQGSEHKPTSATTIDDHGECEAAVLLLRMAEFGISKYHPDPLVAIAAASNKR
jgi:hypothetical protein